MSKRVRGNFFHVIQTHKGDKQLTMVQMETREGMKLKFKIGECAINDLAAAIFSLGVEIESNNIENGLISFWREPISN